MDLDELRILILNKLIEPTIFHDCIKDWSVLKWDLHTWISKIGPRLLPFRVGCKKYSKQPQWESECTIKEQTLAEFVDLLGSGNQKEWSYFDYKHLVEWFQEHSEILEAINWSNLGFPERGGKDSTLWISSEGAHTPCHIDTYGCNLVAQVYGRKQWILFPPDSKDLKPTRVPYEESSIYSEINFYSPPKDLRLQNARVVELNPGDVLFVPAGWWHYVETISPAAISINTWIPLPGDKWKQVEEAVVKTMVASLSHLIPSHTSLLNPNEADIRDDKNILEYLRRALIQCGTEEPPAKKPCLTDPLYKDNSNKNQEKRINSECLLKLKMVSVSEISVEQFHVLAEQKRLRFEVIDEPNITNNRDFSVCKKLINALCHQQVLSLVTQKLVQDDDD